MENVKISLMQLDDLKSIWDILVTDFDDFWSPEILESELKNPNSKYFVAKCDNTILGFGGIWKAVDVMHITDICVRKKFRQQGIATLLLKELIAETKKQNITSITLEVKTTNIPAQNLYSKFGFEILGIRKKYYKNRDDAYIMTMEVNK